jgi:hypothetical protein
MQESVSDARRESRLRPRAQRQGYQVRKSRVRNTHGNDLGGYRIVETQFNTIECGERFDLDLDEVERFLTACT